jgi:predicted TIM-barrel fold metal-dependent hydrolase
MIVDVHAHIFKDLNEILNHKDSTKRSMYFQKAIGNTPATAVRKIKDNQITKDFKLWDDKNPGVGGKLEVNLRVGKYGRFVWTEKFGDVYVNIYPPSLQEMKAPPEFMLAQMDMAGVDSAIIQNAWLYGQMNDYISDAVKKYPYRLVGTIQVREIDADKDDQIDELHRGVEELGLSGLYFSTLRFFENDFKDHIDDKKFFPFWEEVRSLKIPIFFDIASQFELGQSHFSPFERYSFQMKHFSNWLKMFGDISCILVHGVELGPFCNKDKFVDIPDEIWQIWKSENVFLEILFPIQISYPRPGATVWDYPYMETRPMIKKLYEKLGAEKLLWGSDMPNTERNCTYKQSLEYLSRYCTFIPSDAMEKIIGGNAVNLFKIKSKFL